MLPSLIHVLLASNEKYSIAVLIFYLDFEMVYRSGIHSSNVSN